MHTGPNGQPLIEVGDAGLSPFGDRTAMENAVATIQHEIFHYKSANAGGRNIGTEDEAEEYATRMLELFKSHRGDA